jgi:hypothetical protein
MVKTADLVRAPAGGAWLRLADLCTGKRGSRFVAYLGELQPNQHASDPEHAAYKLPPGIRFWYNSATSIEVLASIERWETITISSGVYWL